MLQLIIVCVVCSTYCALVCVRLWIVLFFLRHSCFISNLDVWDDDDDDTAASNAKSVRAKNPQSRTTVLSCIRTYITKGCIRTVHPFLHVYTCISTYRHKYIARTNHTLILFANDP